MKQGLLDEIIENYYQKCVGLPTGKPIVRQNQKNDAFEIVVLETLCRELSISMLQTRDKARGSATGFSHIVIYILLKF